jgi:spermidine/putrescine-binding protein
MARKKLDMKSIKQFGRKRALLTTAAILTAGAMAALSGCSSNLGGQDTSESLVVLNWKGYGSDQEWVTEGFEEATGAKVVHRYISSLQEMIELLGQNDGSIDVALPNFQYIGPAIRQDLIQPLDESKLEGFGDLYPALAEQDAFYSDGDLYGIPWVWGYSSIFYDTTKISEAPVSVADLWDPKYKGKVALPDDPTLAVLLAALYLGEDPDNPDLDAVKTALLALKANVGLITSSVDEIAKAVTAGTIEIGITGSSTAASMAAEGVPIGFTLPAEGAVGWGDTWTIAKGTKKADLAYEWINYVTSAEFETTWADDPAGGSPAPANEVAAEALTAEAQKRVNADPAVLDRLALQGPLPDEQLEAWIAVWESVKAS